MMTIETASMLVLAIQHLSRPTYVDNLPCYIGAFPKGENGYFVRVNAHLRGPDDLVRVMAFAAGAGHDWIMFDRDADTTDDLPIFVWVDHSDDDGDCVHKWSEAADGFDVCTKCDASRDVTGGC